jgi:hypothetical protein
VQEVSVLGYIAQFSEAIFIWGWLFILFFALWIAWETYKYLKHVDYFSAIRWTFLQVTVPEESAQTPKAMENAFDVWGGIHKNPDLIEELFEGYMLAWYSCEIVCTKNRARYILVVPTDHAKFFEGVIYGQYPTAAVQEVEDYTQEFSYQNLEKDYDLYGTEMILAKDDIYPIRTYREYEDALAEDDKFVDPHQALIEAFTNVEDGEHFWVQILIKPIAGEENAKWAEKGQERIQELAGTAPKKPPSVTGGLADIAKSLPGDLITSVTRGPMEVDSKDKKSYEFRLLDPAQEAEMKGILLKITRSSFRVKIRVLHIAPIGKLHKPNIGKAIGAFKQFWSFQFNQQFPDPVTKTNGPNYILKKTRRSYRKRAILLNYQWRDFWGDKSGEMYNAEELATMYHFPIKYVHSPGIERAQAGFGSPPANLPYK